MKKETAEHRRLATHRARRANWKNWGPYLSERAWGTVREDYGEKGRPWSHFPHDQARSRAYRWNEDGLCGICDRYQTLCFALALWNGRDPILKERLFGLDNAEGNHGEDVKELYFYLDSTPTHSYMRMLYKYPQAPFPYDQLVAENRARGVADSEYELFDTGVFDEDRYFDVQVEYAKGVDPDDILIRIEVTNRGPERARCSVLPTLWFRNTWGWGYEDGPMKATTRKPLLRARESGGLPVVETDHPSSGRYLLALGQGPEGADPELLFTENETNTKRLHGAEGQSPYVKDAFHRYLIGKEQSAINPAHQGTKAAGVYTLELDAGATERIELRLARELSAEPFADHQALMQERRAEADAFYREIQAPGLSDDERNVQRQALAGMLWSKQIYYYDVEQWLRGDPKGPRPGKRARNADWAHLSNFDVISMPDKWEYPWYATWDLAFHCVPLALVDPDFAKRQLLLLTREWYMHPSGQLPAYEWNFSDVNPPVHAWAAWRVYKMEGRRSGDFDRTFLERIFHKLLINFTWWVNRKDHGGNNVFQGGFLGLDNISVFDRSAALPTGGWIDQSDGTAWMGAYSLTMMTIALELARENPAYQDSATKFFEHFLRIAHAMTTRGGEYGYSHNLWDEEDGFFYDALNLPSGDVVPLKVRSLVGLLPIFAVETIEPDLLEAMPDFDRRMHWFLEHRAHLSGNMASIDAPGAGRRRLAALLTKERLVRVLARMLDEQEFLSPYGIRSLSKAHLEQPYTFDVDGEAHTINYLPAESQSGLFGGNSNWRGPVWMPINFLIIESLQKFHHYYGDELKVAFPTGSDRMLTLAEIAEELSARLTKLFLRDERGGRPIFRSDPAGERWERDPQFRDLLLFFEYFHGDDGGGLGASHQTGWTGLVAKLLQSQKG